MRVHPILVDVRPGYLQGAPAEHTLLTMPLGGTSLLAYLRDAFAKLTRSPLTVLVGFEPATGYLKALAEASPGTVEAVLTAAEFADWTAAYEPSDWLLLADPRCFPAAGPAFRQLLEGFLDDPRWARHLVALQNGPAGTTECVQLDAGGRVSRIQRYYDSVTWPFAVGVASSLVPVCATLGAHDLPFTSLASLRSALVARGIPSRDLPLEGLTLDLGNESDLLSLNETHVRDAFAADAERSVAKDASVDPTARLVGPVAIQAGAVVEADATIVGPSVLGAGCRVGRGAVVAQSVVLHGAVVAPETTTRHRLVFGEAEGGAPGTPTAVPPPPQPLRSATTTPLELHDDRPLPVYPRIKAIVEPLVALAALLVLSPLMVLIAILVKLESRGSILYGDKREGQGGRTFRCWKFRTMVHDANQRQSELSTANQLDGPQFKLDRDPRVTRMGRWLRPSSLDELPQLINVLTGEMSFVGPRPSPFRENQLCVPWRDARLSVRPGITGLWQVCRHDRSEGDFHQWIYYDLLYVRLMSLAVDLKIVIATIITLGGRTCVPLSWIIPPQDFYDRRGSRRDRDHADDDRPLRRSA